MSWKRGDIARVVTSSAVLDTAKINGQYVELLTMIPYKEKRYWMVAIEGRYEPAYVWEPCLRKYDGDSPASWDDCVWRPSEVCLIN